MGRVRQIDHNTVDTSKCLTPPYSLKLHPHLKQVHLAVTLHRVPGQCIVFEPSPTELLVHTLGFSKKYFLRVPYPAGVTVDAGPETEATFEYGILKAKLSVTSALPAPSQLGKRARSVVMPEADEEDASEPAPSRKKKASVTVSPASTPVAKKKTNKSTDAPAEAAPVDQTAEKNKNKKKKSYLDKESQLNMIEKIAGQQQDRIDQALAKEDAKRAWQADREAVKAKRKAAREDKKKGEKEQIRQELLHKKAPSGPKQSTQPKPALPEPVLPESPQKKKKKVRSESLPEPILPSEEVTELRSILKKQNTPNKKMRVTFSPTVRVKPIPRVKRPATIAPTLYEMLALQSPPIQRKANKMKSRTKRRKYGRRGL